MAKKRSAKMLKKGVVPKKVAKPTLTGGGQFQLKVVKPTLDAGAGTQISFEEWEMSGPIELNVFDHANRVINGYWRCVFCGEDEECQTVPLCLECCLKNHPAFVAQLVKDENGKPLPSLRTLTPDQAMARQYWYAVIDGDEPEAMYLDWCLDHGLTVRLAGYGQTGTPADHKFLDYRDRIYKRVIDARRKT